MKNTIFRDEFFTSLLDGSLENHIFMLSRPKNGTCFVRDITMELMAQQTMGKIQ